MAFKRHRDQDHAEPKAPEVTASEFRHSSGSGNLVELLGTHTLSADATAVAPKGYRARSIGTYSKPAR